jgi:hypothetical protein
VKRLAVLLRAIGVTTPLELRDADPRLIRERFSVVLECMVLELRVRTGRVRPRFGLCRLLCSRDIENGKRVRGFGAAVFSRGLMAG